MACAGIIQEPMKLTWNAALEESEMVMYETVHKLFKQTGFTADDVRLTFDKTLSLAEYSTLNTYIEYIHLVSCIWTVG